VKGDGGTVSQSVGERAKPWAEVMAEIEREVRRRRANGDFPPSLERRLDRLFDRFVPAGTDRASFPEALRRADREAYFDIEVPTASEQPLVPVVKRVLRRLMAWYLNYLVQQLVRFSSSTVRVLHLVDDRLSRLERAVSLLGAGLDRSELEQTLVAARASAWPLAPALDALGETVQAALSGVEGRVLVAECGDGRLLASLVASGVDAYGVDDAPQLIDRAALQGLDVWLEPPLEHLASVHAAGLAGAVVVGFSDRLGLDAKRHLVDELARVLEPGGRLVLLGPSPEGWRSVVGDVEADLSPGRPLSRATWSFLLEQAGFDVAELGTVSVPSGEVALRGEPRAEVASVAWHALLAVRTPGATEPGAEAISELAEPSVTR